jgi:hypothetical protein
VYIDAVFDVNMLAIFAELWAVDSPLLQALNNMLGITEYHLSKQKILI